ncbi:MAG TPA: glycosyltransferase [Clostridia bacterium]|nr:glycosyltransferase [Clostridia bacterium]
MPKVSVIVPVYKAEEYLPRCIESILAQTLKDIEILIVDDGSPDDCPKICDKYEKRDKRIRVIHKQNGGSSDARNTGILVAKGEYIAFIDSDDAIHEKMLETLYKKAKETDADLSSCKIVEFTNGEPQPSSTDFESAIIDLGKLGLLKYVASQKNATGKPFMLSVCNAIFKKKNIKNSGLLFTDTDIVLAEDILFLLSFLSVSKRVCRTNEDYYFHYIREHSLTQENDANDYIQRLVILTAYLEKFLKENKRLHKAKSELDCLLWTFIKIACERYKGDTERIFSDFNSIDEYKRYFKKAMLRLAFGRSGTTYCKHFNIRGKGEFLFRSIAYSLYKEDYERAIFEHFNVSED